MIKLIRTNSENLDFKALVIDLDHDLAIRDGADHSFYAQFNKIDAIKYVVVAYLDDLPVGCGALKAFGENTMEVKRMFVPFALRGRGYALSILKELEKWASEMNSKKCILETGVKQHEAINLYTKAGFKVTPNYGQYIGVENSVCFEKLLNEMG